MKEIIYKLFTAVLLLMIFIGMLHTMKLLSGISDHNRAQKLAEKNSGLSAAGPDIPAVTATAPVRTEPAPITAEDLSYIYIDGIRLDFPCTLAQIQENFETKNFYNKYDEDIGAYRGQKTLMKNGIGTYRIYYTAAEKNSPPEECIVDNIFSTEYSEKYTPQLVVAGIDVFNTSLEEFTRLAAMDKNEYLSTHTIAYPYGDDGYVVFDFLNSNGIKYYKNDDIFLQDILEKSDPVLIKKELRLPEDNKYGIEAERKEELREFAMKYFTEDDDEYYTYFTKLWQNDDFVVLVNDLCITAYEFLADDSDKYDVSYFELDEIESLTDYDAENGQYIDTGFLKVTADCYIEEYDGPVRAEMLLKNGDKLGDALMIRIIL